MHRFLKSKFIHDVQVALRSDASIWLMAPNDVELSVDRGRGWLQATKIRLCRDDRIRIGDSAISLSDLCSHLGIDFRQACDATEQNRDPAGKDALIPLSVPASIIDNARRNPSTGQIEPGKKEQP